MCSRAYRLHRHPGRHEGHGHHAPFPPVGLGHLVCLRHSPPLWPSSWTPHLPLGVCPFGAPQDHLPPDASTPQSLASPWGAGHSKNSVGARQRHRRVSTTRIYQRPKIGKIFFGALFLVRADDKPGRQLWVPPRVRGHDGTERQTQGLQEGREDSATRSQNFGACPADADPGLRYPHRSVRPVPLPFSSLSDLVRISFFFLFPRHPAPLSHEFA